MARPSNREKILLATEAVATELGAAHLTLEAVASRAKMSKGGLLYHFKDKDALLSALVERYQQKCMEQRVQMTRDMGGSAQAMLKAMVMNLWAERPIPPRLHSALAAASATNPKLLTPVKKMNTQIIDLYRQSFKDMREPGAVLMAAYGMLFMDLMHFQPFTPAEKKELLDYLMERIEALAKKPGAPDNINEAMEDILRSSLKK